MKGQVKDHSESYSSFGQIATVYHLRTDARLIQLGLQPGLSRLMESSIAWPEPWAQNPGPL